MIKTIIQKLFTTDQPKPNAVQCLWHSDYEYIGLTIDLVFKNGFSYKTENITELEYKNFETEEALVQEARKIAKEYTDRYQIELYFPSPDEWSRDCPNWSESHTAPKCKDCHTPIIPTDSKYLPKEVCYPCHLTRESNEKIRNDESVSDGVTMCLSKGDEYEHIGYCSDFNSFPIAPFIAEKVQLRKDDKAISEVILDKADILELQEDLQNALQLNLIDYKKPEEYEGRSSFKKTYTVEYKGIEYELFERLNADHEAISNLIRSLKRNERAIENGYVYRIFFKNGITYRDDSLLRFVNYRSKGSADIESINKNYKNIVSESDIMKTIEKLISINCLKRNENSVVITKIGKSIL